MRSVGMRFLFVLLLLSFSVWGKQDFFAQGNKLYDQGKFLEAVKYYRAAIQQGQMEPYAWFNLGNCMVQLKKNNLAMVAYKRTTELVPRFARAWVLLGDLYFIHGEIGRAIAHYGRARELGENSDHLRASLAECYKQVREYAYAEREYEALLQSNEDRVDIWFSLTEIKERQQDYPEATRILQRAIRILPTAGADAYFYLAYLYFQQDSLAQGMSALEDGLLLNPGNYSARRHLANLYLQQNSPWMAIFTLEQGLSGKQPVQERELEVDLGLIYFEQKRYGEALDYYIRAWKHGASQGRIGAENVGHAWANLGDTTQAQWAYRRVRMKE